MGTESGRSGRRAGVRVCDWNMGKVLVMGSVYGVLDGLDEETASKENENM